jgi:hypothetical protein
MSLILSNRELKIISLRDIYFYFIEPTFKCNFPRNWGGNYSRHCVFLRLHSVVAPGDITRKLLTGYIHFQDDGSK